MSARRRGLLVSALVDPSVTLTFTLAEWNELLLAAREQVLLGRLAAMLRRDDLLSRAPHKAQGHMRGAAIAAESAQTAIRFEVNRVSRALASVDTPVVLLKGAAYVMAGLPPAVGRYVGDLDFMVPRASIDEVERALLGGGWVGAEMNEYDQRYYREWAHEIPPLQHRDRETPVDVHHTIVALTARVRPDASALLSASVPIAGTRLRVLSPADMVLHSAVHLFNDDVGKPLRDLLDLHDLLLGFGAREGFWDELVTRANLHGLGRPLYYALRETQRVFGTPIPASAVQASVAWAPGSAIRLAMDRLHAYRFADDAPEQKRAGSGLATWLLYVRSHWLRMPFPLLVRHLATKGIRRARERFERGRDDEEGVRPAA